MQCDANSKLAHAIDLICCQPPDVSERPLQWSQIVLFCDSLSFLEIDLRNVMLDRMKM
jgi:hypothetical protein